MTERASKQAKAKAVPRQTNQKPVKETMPSIQQALSDPARLVQLQRMIGNHAVSQLIMREAGGKKPNATGMPDNLKSGIENLSGLSLDDVRVHYNSPKPAQLQALAYSQGSDIHIGPGQESHLPHEAWHVVQQKQGRVAPTVLLEGTHVNEDKALEKEADEMGAKALEASPAPTPAP